MRTSFTSFLAFLALSSLATAAPVEVVPKSSSAHLERRANTAAIGVGIVGAAAAAGLALGLGIPLHNANQKIKELEAKKGNRSQVDVASVGTAETPGDAPQTHETKVATAEGSQQEDGA